MHLSALPATRAAEDPSAPALSDEVESLDNGAFAARVDAAARALRSAGAGRGVVVAVILPNSAAMVVALFAIWRLGAVVSPVNPNLAEPEVRFQLADAAAAIVITDAAHAGLVGDQAVIVLTELSPGHADTVDLPDPAGLPTSELALLIYTSGTTGKPKGVMLSHDNLLAMSDMLIGELELSPADRALLVLPLFHANAILLSTLSPLRAGGSMVVAAKFEPGAFLEIVQRVRPTYFSGVPTVFSMLVTHPDAAACDFSSLRFAVCGAAPATPELLAEFEQLAAVPIIEGYGLSEGTCASAINPLRGPRKSGSVGRVIDGQRIRIVDEAGTLVATGRPGEVQIAGPNVMLGYLGRPDDTAATIVDGWLRTGDVGVLDDDGFLRIVDRIKDMIIKGGENLYPKEIESVAAGAVGVLEVAVVGRPDARLGEVPVLFVSARPDAPLDLDALRAHLAGELSRFKLPAEIVVLEQLPKNPVGKIDKPALRRMHHRP